MISFRFEPKSVRSTVKSVRLLEQKYKDAINRAISFALIRTRSEAIKNINKNRSVNTGQLRAKIAMVHKKEALVGDVLSEQNYSSAVEFGRKPGSFPDIQAITWWVKRKKIGVPKNQQSIAFAIAKSISRKGVKPRPFMHSAFEVVKPLFVQRYTSEIKNATRK